MGQTCADLGTVSNATSITSSDFVGPLTGQADTVATITGLAPDTATTQAAQPNITSLGTITSLVATTADINGGTLDGVQIGGTTATGELIVNNASDEADGLGSQGTSGQVLTSAGAGSNLTFQTPLFSESFTSAEQTITAGGTLTLGHSLSGEPKIVELHVVCKTSEYGYSIGDHLLINPAASDPGGANARGISALKDATNIILRYGLAAASIGAIRHDNGQSVGLTNANWKLVVSAFN